MQAFIDLLKGRLDLGDRHISIDPHPTTGQLFINYYNVPEKVYKAKEGGGAERENNRLMLTVLFPGKHGWYEKPVADGTLRVSSHFSCIPTVKPLRGKTCTPERMADYIAGYLNNIAKTVPPKYTHTKL